MCSNPVAQKLASTAGIWYRMRKIEVLLVSVRGPSWDLGKWRLCVLGRGVSALLMREEEGDDLVQIPYSCLSFHTFISFLISCFFIFCFSLRPFLEALYGCFEVIIFNSTIGECVSRVSFIWSYWKFWSLLHVFFLTCNFEWILFIFDYRSSTYSL